MHKIRTLTHSICLIIIFILYLKFTYLRSIQKVTDSELDKPNNRDKPDYQYNYISSNICNKTKKSVANIKSRKLPFITKHPYDTKNDDEFRWLEKDGHEINIDHDIEKFWKGQDVNDLEKVLKNTTEQIHLIYKSQFQLYHYINFNQNITFTNLISIYSIYKFTKKKFPKNLKIIFHTNDKFCNFNQFYELFLQKLPHLGREWLDDLRQILYIQIVDDENFSFHGLNFNENVYHKSDVYRILVLSLVGVLIFYFSYLHYHLHMYFFNDSCSLLYLLIHPPTKISIPNKRRPYYINVLQMQRHKPKIYKLIPRPPAPRSYYNARYFCNNS